VGAKKAPKRKKQPLQADPAPAPVIVSKHVFASKKQQKKKVYGVTMPIGGRNAIEAHTLAEAKEKEQEAETKRKEHTAERLCRLSQKNDFYGLGYDRFGQASEFEDYTVKRDKDRAAAIARDIEEHHQGPTKAGVAFGLGALEDADKFDDCYETPSIKEYDLELTNEAEAAADAKVKRPQMAPDVAAALASSGVDARLFKERGLWSRFHVATTRLPSKKVFAPPKLPPGYEPFHRFGDTEEAPGTEGVRNMLTAMRTEPGRGLNLNHKARGNILGEVPLKETMPPPPPVARPLPPETREQKRESRRSAMRPEHAAALPVGTAADMMAGLSTEQLRKFEIVSKNILKQGSNAYVPYPVDVEKQMRYVQWLRMFAGSDPEGVQQEITPEEMEEFCRVAYMYQPKETILTSRFVSVANEDEADDPSSALNEFDQAAEKNMFGKLTRETHEWHPLPLLCRRCNVRNPYPDSDLKGTKTESAAKQPGAEDEMMFGAHITAGAIDAPIEGGQAKTKSKKPSGAIQFESSGKQGGVTLTEEKALEEAAEKLKARAEAKPAMDLFQDIFGDSDSDEEGDSVTTTKSGGTKPSNATVAGAASGTPGVASVDEDGDANVPRRGVAKEASGAPEKRPLEAADTADTQGCSKPKSPKKKAAKKADVGLEMLRGVFGDDDVEDSQVSSAAASSQAEVKEKDVKPGLTQQSASGEGDPKPDSVTEGEETFTFRKPKFQRTRKRQKTAADFM